MSKNKNRKRTEKAQDNKEYNIIEKNIGLYCYICVKRGGSYDSSCAPKSYNTKYKRGFKNPHKRIEVWKARMYRTWKYNRLTQWKE